MFQPISMQHITLSILTEDIPLTAQILAKWGLFNPEIMDVATAQVMPEQPGQRFRIVFNNARNRLEKILARKPAGLIFAPINSYQTIELTKLEMIDTQLGELWQQLSELDESLHQLNEQQAHLKQLFGILKKFAQLDLDLGLLQQPKQFLNIHVGTIPTDNLAHLQASITLAEHFVNLFHRDENRVYCVIVGPLSHQQQVQSVLEHAEFSPVTIPPQFKNYPHQVHAQLTEQSLQLQQQVETILTQQNELLQQQDHFIVEAYQILQSVAAYVELTDTLKSRGQLTLIEGWIPTADLPKLQTKLDEQLEGPYVLHHRPPSLEEHQQVPSLLRHPNWLESFATLVKNYGIPRYGEFDPTILFAVSFIIMFGTMFGDVGHGVVIAGLGIYFNDKLKEFKIFFMSAGFSSIVFGFLYGSFFGFEEVLLPPLWVSPIHNPSLMLTMALYWGIGFISLATAIKVINGWRERNYAEALFDSSGGAGILLLMGGFYAIKQWMATGIFDTSQQFALLIPLTIILVYKGYENKLPLGERVLVTLIEGFESIIKYFANTLSFLRVAAFSLNHAALAIAVLTLAEMMNGTGKIFMIIFGNLFIIGFEGAIVMIQILRLEYYEGFSRFFRGDGRAFRPLTVGLRKI
ncbi:MAG: hypothetical protein BWK79_13025 [Beggiatoa sp. IS2]|nr:MAG: hypothetical protein BWK79_13025 [Beggiatoa sp. IS2]